MIELSTKIVGNYFGANQMLSEGKGGGEGSRITQFKPRHPKAGGRKAGTPNKTTASVRELVGQHLEAIVGALLEIAQDKDAPASARVAACRELLDRAEGRPAQRIEQVVKDETNDKYNDIANEIRLKFMEEYGN